MKKHIDNKNEQPKHVLAVIEGFNQLLRRPINSLILVFVFAAVLFLPTSFYILWNEIDAVNDRLNQSAAISLYLKKKVNSAAIASLTAQLRQNFAVAKMEMISPEEGMKKFIEQIDLGGILTGLKENPLPHLIIVYPRLNELTQEQILTFIDTLKKLPEVEIVKTDKKWIELSKNLLDMWQQMIKILLLLFSIGAVIIICYVAYITTIIIVEKGSVSTRVLQYQYIWYGLIGGLVALALVNFLLMLLNNSCFALQELGAKKGMVFVLFNILLSVIGSKIALFVQGKRTVTEQE